MAVMKSTGLVVSSPNWKVWLKSLPSMSAIRNENGS